MAEVRIWNVCCSGKMPDGDNFMDVNFEMLAFAEDAGAAWLQFQNDSNKVKWHEISVTEVKRK